MKVKDFMIKNVYTCNPNDSLKSVLNTFVTYKIGGVPVVDDSGKLIDILSDGDILRYLSYKDLPLYYYGMFAFETYCPPIKLPTSIKEKINENVSYIIDNKKLYSVKENDEMEKALEILAKHRFKKIPVVNEQGKLVGILSRGDIIRQIHILLLDL